MENSTDSTKLLTYTLINGHGIYIYLDEQKNHILVIQGELYGNDAIKYIRRILANLKLDELKKISRICDDFINHTISDYTENATYTENTK